MTGVNPMRDQSMEYKAFGGKGPAIGWQLRSHKLAARFVRARSCTLQYISYVDY